MVNVTDHSTEETDVFIYRPLCHPLTGEREREREREMCHVKEKIHAENEFYQEIRSSLRALIIEDSKNQMLNNFKIILLYFVFFD